MYGAIALDHAVGGLNPDALDAVLRIGTRVVWWPTFDSAWSRDTFGRWHAEAEAIRVLDGEGALLLVCHTLLDLMSEHDATLCSGHLDPAETLALVTESRRRDIRSIVSHATSFRIPLEVQRALTERGALIEQCSVNSFREGGDAAFEAIAADVRAVGRAIVPPVNILIIPGVTMPIVDEALLARIHKAAGPGTQIRIADTPGEAIEAMEDVAVVLGAITPAMFARARRLRWVHAITSGADAYLFPDMVASDILLSGDKGLVGSHLADHTFALLLSLTRRLARAVQDGPRSWEHRVAYRAEEFELEGCTMGIVGFGGTGRAIARRAVGFGMRCIAVDCDPVSPTAEVPEVWGSDRLDELFRSADVVTSGLPLASSTRHLFNARAFDLMKPSAILVNVTRGEVVDADALVAAVRNGQIAGAGLDVAPVEPLPAEHPLWSTPNVVMTPHTAGASQFRISRNMDRFCRNLASFRAGEPLEGLINKARGF